MALLFRQTAHQQFAVDSTW